MKPLSTIEKQHKKRRDNLRLIHNGLLSQFSFKKITSWADVYKHLGYINGEAPADELTYPKLKEFLSLQSQELEKDLLKEANPLHSEPSNDGITVNTLSTFNRAD